MRAFSFPSLAHNHSMVKNIASILIFCSSFMAMALNVPNEHFVKAKDDKAMKQFAQKQHLFADFYWVRAPKEKILDLQKQGLLEYFSANTKAEKVALMQDRVPLDESVRRHGAAGTDPLLNRQYSHNTPQSGGMNIKEYWKRFANFPRSEVIVAVVDTGVDYNHEDLSEVMWINDDEIAANGIDDDNNGYVDDVYGINTLDRDASGKATSEVMDTHSHGTHVSGIIAAKRNNGKGVAGIADKARIMALKTVPGSGDETDRDVAEAFLYAARNGAKIINCSFGKRVNEGGLLVKETIDYIGQEFGVLVVAAAGNDNTDIDRNLRYPASFDSETLFVIASTTSRGERSYFSNYGELSVDMAAPGSSVLSTTPGNRYESFSGTSMASPNAAGVAAELLSVDPTLGPLDLKQKVMNSAYLKDEFDFWFVVRGWIDLFEAFDRQ
ncbi:S8 family serine peptidase [bacterium]|nr:S8 family serine peptidase [bacterium]